jgi:hypothetical protein
LIKECHIKELGFITVADGSLQIRFISVVLVAFQMIVELCEADYLSALTCWIDCFQFYLDVIIQDIIL